MKTIKGILLTVWHFIKKWWHYLLLLILFIVSLAIPFGINEAYKVGEGYITLWDAPDVLAFYGAYISFIGTVVLGVIAVEQNKKAHRLNEQMQKLQQAQFVSMISIKRLEIDKRSSEYPNYVNTNMREIEVLNCTGSGVKSTYCYHIDEMDFKPDEIMQRFARGDKARSTKGSGLGLHISPNDES